MFDDYLPPKKVIIISNIESHIFKYVYISYVRNLYDTRIMKKDHIVLKLVSRNSKLGLSEKKNMLHCFSCLLNITYLLIRENKKNKLLD